QRAGDERPQLGGVVGEGPDSAPGPVAPPVTPDVIGVDRQAVGEHGITEVPVAAEVVPVAVDEDHAGTRALRHVPLPPEPAPRPAPRHVLPGGGSWRATAGEHALPD